MDNKPKYSVLCITRNVTDDIIYKNSIFRGGGEI